MKQHAQASQNRYAYSGKLICAKHGTTFHLHVYKSKRRGEVECWNCKLYRLKGKQGGAVGHRFEPLSVISPRRPQPNTVLLWSAFFHPFNPNICSVLSIFPHHILKKVILWHI